MKIYQCIHKYAPHIPQFEARHGISDELNISFSQLQSLIIQDGYAAVYRLEPPSDAAYNMVFFTIWDYERLQRLWAKEHNLSVKCSLDDIRIAQIQWLNADVVYDMSGYYHREFISKLKEASINCTTVLWNGIIEQQVKPLTLQDYDYHVSLYRPYIDAWQKQGMKAFELQPSIPKCWESQSDNMSRDVDILMYGQTGIKFFNERNKLINQLLTFKLKYNISVKLQISDSHSVNYFYDHIMDIEPPVYGVELYNAIRRSKIVINKCTDNNFSFKSNMRVFEAIGNGALLVTEKGAYPEGIKSGIDFLEYSSTEELWDLIDNILEDWDKWSAFANKAKVRLMKNFSKKSQWATFTSNIINSKALSNQLAKI